MELRSLFRIVGSLKFAAVILVLLCIAMACATVYEAMHGTPAALATFYKSTWFEGLLALLGINVLASLLARFPWSQRQVGFVLTHTSILAILGGAYVSKHLGIDGQVSIVEGRSATQFSIVNQDALAVQAVGERQPHEIVLKDTGGFRPIQSLKMAPAVFGELQIAVEQYVPDSRAAERIVNDNPEPSPALEVRLSGAQSVSTAWVFAGQQPNSTDLPISLSVARDQGELDQFVSPPATQPAPVRTVIVEVKGTKFEYPLDQALSGPLQIGDTGLSLRVLRYLPHAQVSDGKKLISASDRPVNPAIEFEVVSEAETSKGVAFARFPDFGAMHGAQGAVAETKVSLNVPGDEKAAAAIELMVGPDGAIAARFQVDDSAPVIHTLELGTPVTTPWAGLQFTVLQRFDRARREPTIEAVSPPGVERTPAVLVTAQVGDQRKQVWLRKYEPVKVRLGGKEYELFYAYRTLPLGFEIQLRKFQIGRYPGSNQPRTFESHVTLVDADGAKQERVISMNNPAKLGGYTLFQSSYQQSRSGPSTTVLSVSSDPGLPIVFVGYSVLIFGMFYTLVMRLRDSRRMKRLTAEIAEIRMNG